MPVTEPAFLRRWPEGRAGFWGNDFSLAAADCLKVAAFAGLIGLFAEPATLKLRDIFNTLFTPRNDPRKNPAKDGSAAAPVLVSLDPSAVTAGQEPHPAVTLKGTGFSDCCQVKIGASLRTPTQQSETELVVGLAKADIAKPGKLDVVLVNQPQDGELSNSLSLQVN